MRKPTEKEKAWLDKITKLLKHKPKGMVLHTNDNVQRLRIYEASHIYKIEESDLFISFE